MKAKRYQVSNFFNEAIALYEEIMEGIDKGYYPKALLTNSLIPKKVRYRLAESYFQLENFEKSLELIDADKKVEDVIDREMIYLAALCFREKEEYERALTLFSQYANSGNRGDLDHYDHALFEIGLFFYQANNLIKARQHFELVHQLKRKKGKPAIVAALYLARIELKEKKPKEVEKILAPLASQIGPNNPLGYECAFLRGEAAYAMEDFSKAQIFFEKSLPSNQKGSAWTLQALLHLGRTYVELGNQKKAEEIFKKLLLSSEKEAATLALARLYLKHNHLSYTKATKKQIEELFAEWTNDFSMEGKLQVLLLRAEAEKPYLSKESFYKLATGAIFRHERSYATAWYLRGLNHFQEGIKFACEGPYFELARGAFEEAFRVWEKSDRTKAAHALKFEVKANFYCNSPLSSLTLLEQLLTQFDEEDEETLYLRGLITSRLTDLSYFPVAETSLKQVFTHYPQGEYADRALYVLGTLYYNQENFTKAKETFLHLARNYPSSKHGGDAWFWAAEAAEKEEDENMETANWRRQVFERYPDCSRAPEAYFRLFSYSDYFEKAIGAIDHLKAFSRLFPDSPLLVVVNYLIGINTQQLEEAKGYFEKAIKAFHLCLEEGKIPQSSYVYFRYQAMLKLALAYLTHYTSPSDLEKSHQLLNEIVNDFSEKNHPLATLLMQKTSYPSLFEESEYELVQCYFKQGKELRAQQRLSQMLEHYSKEGIQKGYYLSQVWSEQGRLALRCEDYETALRCFKIAEECGKGFFSDNQCLSLWICQSDAHRGLSELESAIKMLSKAINADMASLLRLKALYLRAEIYELQGRPELAIRQLEAIAKKGGEWALQAREKLRLVYGIQ